MDTLNFILCALGACLIFCTIIDVSPMIGKARKMKFDPDWIDFIIGSCLVVLGSIVAVFIVVQSINNSDEFF